MNKQKSNVLLLEIIVVVFFLSILSVVLLQTFSNAYIISNNDARTSKALFSVQEWAERMRAQEDIDAFLTGNGWTVDPMRGEDMHYRYADDKQSLYIYGARKDSVYGTLYELTVEAQFEGEVLASIPFGMYNTKGLVAGEGAMP